MKSPEERGRIGAWAYEARVGLDLSVEQVIERLPTRYHPATLRKVESGSAQPGRRMLRELADLYGSSPEPLEATETPESTAAIVAAVERAIAAQTQAIVAALQARDATLEGLLSELGRYRENQLGVLRALTAPRAEPMPPDEAEPDPPEPAPKQSALQ